MWLYFLVASSVTAYVSALAGAMGASVVIGVVALYEVEFMGKSLGPLQIFLMCTLFCNSGLYTYLKDKHNKELVEQKVIEKELRHTTAMSTLSNKAQVGMIRRYTPSFERPKLARGMRSRWNSSNPALLELANQVCDETAPRLLQVHSWPSLFTDEHGVGRYRSDSDVV